ncbi:patched family protein, partial [Ostertagia ostertagi]
ENNVYGITLKNGTKQLEAFTTAILQFYLVSSYEDVDVIYRWLLAVRETFKEKRFSILQCEVTGDSFVSAEVRRMGVETAPMITMSVIAMIFFVVIFSLRRDPSRAKPWESLSIIVAAFFLVISVGVDDVFIILRAWDRTNTEEEVPERMAQTLEEAGPSILISSITNAMAFFIGMTSQTPAVRSFSLYSAIAISICFFYQLIMFCAVLAASALFLACGASFGSASGSYSAIFSNSADMANKVHISDLYGLLLLRVCCRHPTIARTLISVEKMALPDSYLQTFQSHFEASLANMQPITVFILNPGDLRDPKRYRDFENSTYAYGPESTFFWITAYEEFLNFYGETEEFTYAEMPRSSTSATYFYLDDVRQSNNHELIPALKDWRRIAAKYSDYDVVPYTEHAPFIDQPLAIDSTVWVDGSRSAVHGNRMLYLHTEFGMYHNSMFLCASHSHDRILDYLSLWGIDLDPLSMAALLMAVGFSVDFTSHIAYHYYKSKQQDPALRLEETLTSIGWPLVQVGLSTIIAISPLTMKPSYLVMVFFKTIVVVCTLGMFHGLVIMPAILTAISQFGKSSAAPSVTDSSEVSERSSDRSSVERQESFYRNPAVIFKLNRDIKHNKVAPETTVALEKADGQEAFKHNIVLGQVSPIPHRT